MKIRWKTNIHKTLHSYTCEVTLGPNKLSKKTLAIIIGQAQRGPVEK